MEEGLAGSVVPPGLFFALCKSCFWTASVLGAAKPFSFSSCPLCLEGNMAIIPLTQKESFHDGLPETAEVGSRFSARRGGLLDLRINDDSGDNNGHVVQRA